MRSRIIVVTLALALGACGRGPEVTQGRVAFIDVERHVLVVETAPDGAEATFDIAGADIGTPPETGDEVRVAYRAEGETLRATRVMNVTRQEGAGTAGH